MNRSSFFSTVTTIAAVLFAAEFATADTLHVPGTYATIQAAIDAALEGDVVEIADGTYTGAGNKNLDFGGKAITVRSASGDPALCVIDCEEGGRAFYFHTVETVDSVVSGIRIIGGYVDDGAVAGEDGGGVLCYGSCPTLADCVFVGNDAEGNGGGLACLNQSCPTVTACVFTGNDAVYGGGVYCGSYSTASFQECSFTENSATYGAAVHCNYGDVSLTACNVSQNTGEYGSGGVDCHEYSSLQLTNCTITDNVAFLGGAGGGVDCYDDCEATLVKCTITGNSSYEGGGLRCYDSDLTASDCCISENVSYGDGGGICCQSCNPVFRNCIVTQNTAQSEGGGIHSFLCDVALTECTISGNAAQADGGGIYVSYERPTLTRCAISGNVSMGSGGGLFLGALTNAVGCMITDNAAAIDGGGFYVDGCSGTFVGCTLGGNSASAGGGIYSMYGESELVNCVLWGSSPEEILAVNDSSHPDELIPQLSYCDIRGGWLGVGNIDADPLFISVNGPDGDPNTWQDNNYCLAAGSPCIDAGNNAAVPADMFDTDDDGDVEEPLPFDLDGNPRFVDDFDTLDTGHGAPPVVDMGAYEYQRPIAGAPSQPQNLLPTNSKVGVPLTVLLVASSFEDPDPNDTHEASHWVIDDTPEFEAPVSWDSGTVDSLTTVQVPAGALELGRQYYWRVQYRDSRGIWSEYSQATSFVTLSPPDQPGNLTPADNAAEIETTPWLIATAFSDPDPNSVHDASQWQVAGDPEFGSVIWDSGVGAPASDVQVPEGYLVVDTWYHWRVRYRDDSGLWSEYSLPTRFRTPEDCPGDLDYDGDIDLLDLQRLLSSYGESGVGYSAGDVNRDGLVNLADLQNLLSHYGETCR